jgi:hypothetical protein
MEPCALRGLQRRDGHEQSAWIHRHWPWRLFGAPPVKRKRHWSPDATKEVIMKRNKFVLMLVAVLLGLGVSTAASARHRHIGVYIDPWPWVWAPPPYAPLR